MLIVDAHHLKTSHRQKGTPWVSWFVGAALLAGVVAVALHISEERQFIRLARQIQPLWLALALSLQAATYLAQAMIWRSLAGLTNVTLGFFRLYELSIAKLFVDQALPSGGISGTLFEARALERRGMPRAAVKAGIIVNTFSFYAAFVVALTAALAILWLRGQSNAVVWTLAIPFIAFGACIAILLPLFAGRRPALPSRGFGRFKIVRTAFATLSEADPSLVRNPKLEIKAVALQLGTMLLDAATIWILLLSIGTHLSFDRTFASFMVASLIRTAGFIPGGLGTFEATLVLLLAANGASVPSALSVTLAFRGFSFWLPMAPGFLLSRRAIPANANVDELAKRRATT